MTKTCYDAPKLLTRMFSYHGGLCSDILNISIACTTFGFCCSDDTDGGDDCGSLGDGATAANSDAYSSKRRPWCQRNAIFQRVSTHRHAGLGFVR